MLPRTGCIRAERLLPKTLLKLDVKKLNQKNSRISMSVEESFFEKKIIRMCQGFSFRALDKCDQDYLISMFNQIKNTESCPKGGGSFNKSYPNARNFRFTLKDQTSETSCSYGSHLLNQVKYFLTWDFGPEEN